MLYHALRLACITVSSFKTWKAMVDSGDRSLAKRYMFLWFLTLAGLSIEPIADSVVGPWIPMYEGFKIIVAGWLLLAHFYLTKPGTDRDADPGWVTEDHYQHVQYPLVDSNSQPLYLTATPRAASTASTQKHAFQPVDRIVTSSASDLDFGRFKRELVRRQTSGSIHSHTDLGFSASVSRVRRPNSTDLYPTTSASVLARARSPANAANGNMLIPSAATAPLTNKMSHSTLEIYKFGVGAESRKRPFSAASSVTQNPRSISRQGSRRSNKMDHPSAGDVDPMEPDTSNSRMTKRTRQMLEEEYAGEVAAGRASSRVDVVAGHTVDMTTKRQQQQQGLLLGTETTATATATGPALRFSRPKPPGRNRKELLPHSAISSSRPKAAAMSTLQRQGTGRSESRSHALPTPLDTHSPRPPLRTEPVSANLESRMKSVRNWLKERKPSMISPPLSAKSEFSNRFTGADNMNDLRAQHNTTAATTAINKRKAQRQLPPRMGSKRQAHGGQGYGLEEDGHGRIYPAVGDTVASVPPPHLQRHDSSSSQPSRRAALARGSSGGSFLQSPDPQRDQPTSDPFFPPVNWNRFQKRNSSSSNNNTNHNHSSAPPKATASSVSAFPTSAFTFRMKNTPGNSNHNSNSKSVNPFLASLFSGDSDDNNAIISPLIKLRQSQLKQRQQEDFLGIGRDDSPAASRRFEEEGGLTFNETLEAWQREDDDVLAQNAAREAAETEARGQGLGLGHGRNESSFSSDEGRKSTSLSNNLPSGSSMGVNKHTSSPSLLRTVEFNGQSSRRSEPDLHAKKQDHSSTPLRPHKDVGASHTARAVASPRRTASLQTLSSSFGRGASRLVKSMSYPGSRTAADSTGLGRRQRHPGLYTPSKKKPTFDMASLHMDPPPPQSPHTSTPTGMSRYIQLSALSESEDV